MQPTRRSSLFLLELIIAILLFILAAAICVQVFVKSHLLEQKSNDLSQAVLASASVAEILRSDGDYEDLLLHKLGAKKLADGRYRIYYDENWGLTDSSGSVDASEAGLTPHSADFADSGDPSGSETASKAGLPPHSTDSVGSEVSSGSETASEAGLTHYILEVWVYKEKNIQISHITVTHDTGEGSKTSLEEKLTPIYELEIKKYIGRGSMTDEN